MTPTSKHSTSSTGERCRASLSSYIFVLYARCCSCSITGSGAIESRPWQKSVDCRQRRRPPAWHMRHSIFRLSCLANVFLMMDLQAADGSASFMGLCSELGLCTDGSCPLTLPHLTTYSATQVQCVKLDDKSIELKFTLPSWRHPPLQEQGRAHRRAVVRDAG